MTISISLNEEDAKLIKAYAEMNNTTLSDLIRNAIIEKSTEMTNENIDKIVK